MKPLAEEQFAPRAPRERVDVLVRVPRPEPGEDHLPGVRPAWFRDRSTTFQPEHDGRMRTYRVELPAKGKVVALRFDPAQGPGEIAFELIRVSDREGKLLADGLEEQRP